MLLLTGPIDVADKFSLLILSSKEKLFCSFFSQKFMMFCAVGFDFDSSPYLILSDLWNESQASMKKSKRRGSGGVTVGGGIDFVSTDRRRKPVTVTGMFQTLVLVVMNLFQEMYEKCMCISCHSSSQRLHRQIKYLLLHGRQKKICPTKSIPWLLMAWRHKAPCVARPSAAMVLT